MALSKEKMREYVKRLLLSRMRILINHGFYGLLLMHVIFSVDDSTDTAYTDGERIAFSPTFLDGLSDSELDFILMHEILHIVLRHALRDDDKDHLRYDTASDIVVNSIILLENDCDLQSITLSQSGISMHTTPDGQEGNLYTTEEVYEMLSPLLPSIKGGSSGGKQSSKTSNGKQLSRKNNKTNLSFGNTCDDHSRWGKSNNNEQMLRSKWNNHISEAHEAMKNRSCGNIPKLIQRLLDELMKPQIDWRSILNDFVQEEINNYSFSPPDRRFQNSPFFLPDFNEKDYTVKNILFMIDTSGSMTNEMITAAYSEVKGAIEQFNGKLRGWLGFFDVAISEPIPFLDIDEFSLIKPVGGGGTNFKIIFDYVSENMLTEPPASIIILTDGYAPFPKETAANGIPVLWLLNNDKIKPPWGKIARIRV